MNEIMLLLIRDGRNIPLIADTMVCVCVCGRMKTSKITVCSFYRSSVYRMQDNLKAGSRLHPAKHWLSVNKYKRAPSLNAELPFMCVQRSV